MAVTDTDSDLLIARSAKIDALRQRGIDPFPRAFHGVEPIARVRTEHEDLGVGEEASVRHRIAGRLAARRAHGRMAFLDLVDRSSSIQLQARVNELGPLGMEQLLELDLGDLVGFEGSVFRSRRDELTLRVEAFTVLAKSLRPPPDKHHGLRDVQTRFRRRELDLIANRETRELFACRARVISAIRAYLDTHHFIEVETPILQPLYGGAAARPFITHHNALDRDLYLRIAPELYLKRLIVGGLERVYEIGKDFRNEGISPKHNPEFTMLEAYEAYADYGDIATRCEELVTRAAAELEIPDRISLSRPWRRETLRGAIEARTGIDILELHDVDSLTRAMRTRRLPLPDGPFTWPQLVDELVSRHVEPDLTSPTFLFDYPVELSPFAKTHRDDARLAERFELYIGGIEIANAFTELNDPEEQRRRFEQQRLMAGMGDVEAQPFDEIFLQALEQGMPPTGGIGIGIDRLIMVLSGRRSIREVVLFPTMRD